MIKKIAYVFVTLALIVSFYLLAYSLWVYGFYATELCLISLVLFVIFFVIKIIIYIKSKPKKKFKISFEKLLVINAFLTYFSFHIFGMYWMNWQPLLYLTFNFLVFLITIYIVINIIKSKKIKKHFLILNISKNLKITYKLIIGGGALILIDTYFYITNGYYQRLVVKITIDLLLLIYFIEHIIEYQNMCNNIEKIAKGNYNVRLQNDFKLFNPLTTSVNNISAGMKVAVEERVKSERLKTDLITNVSHDLKTPLTSIINYVKLLKKEDIRDKKITKYITVLDEKSERLKNLTDDLIEASKISSGSEKLNLETLNLVELVLQANGEFSERFTENKLEIISDIKDEEILLELDSKKTWRVFENIYSNVCKYSLKNSRVYVEIKKEEEKVIFYIRNISKDKLNISPDELMERFVRGDSSRNTSGNGLGLSIAKNLIELQDGIFNIYIEGDLFKVEIIFNIY